MSSALVDLEKIGMQSMIGFIDRGVIRTLALADDRKGVTALEYGIIASILGLVLVTIFKNFGSTLTVLFSKVSSSI